MACNGQKRKTHQPRLELAFLSIAKMPHLAWQGTWKKMLGRHAVMNLKLEMPRSSEEGNACSYYMRTGSCKFGVACKFHHPQPASAGTFSPVSGPAVYGFPSSSVPTSSGLHFGGGAPTMSLPRVPYLSGPFAQGPQAYIPLVLSPSEGIAAHGWNTLLGCSSLTSSGGLQPSSALNLPDSLSYKYFGEGWMYPTLQFRSTSVPGTDLDYNVTNQSEAAFGGLVQSSTVNSYQPERPDQPECRRFMSTGSCKYGFYGFCEYGPTCKYDHPLTGYSYNSDLNFPTLPVFYPPVFPYQRNLPMVLSLEQSPPKLASISDWVKKPEAEVNENPKLDTETPENASEHAISPQLPLSDSSELSHEHSD
ncbi:hypothetical protein RHSIM_Rhsim04G0048700 [Rhododendron simsii]|uniref:C3H1-type domain-containing protein n=1 Tax=Rhododendron simsii TaxID=118357 RepID=A0A834LQV9_RHOSS|nr:hypothetical protein RHSIM_Rhsim04G0048700 [Rhododendron simsii]